MDTIIYNTNWNNKLECPCHTTLRLRNDNKYYHGKNFEEVLRVGKKERSYGIAKIIAIKHIKLEAINEFISRIDTGYGRDECIDMIETMYKKYNINWDVQWMSLILLVKN